MKSMGLFENRRFVLATAIVPSVILLIVIAKILTAGQEGMTALINDAASFTCASAASVLFTRAWLSTSGKDISRRIWGLLAIGLILWTIAEGIWGFYEVILGEETPYPSIADFFWILGYLPLYLALFIRYRVFQTTFNRWQRWFISVIVILFSVFIFFYVIKPILMDFDQQRILESGLNIAYPLVDLILLILTFIIVFSLEEGRFAIAWRVLTVGLICLSVSDLMFSYATWNEVYYPEGQLNFISAAIDVLYDGAYLLLGLSIYTYGLISELQQTSRINLVLRSLTKSNTLVFIDPHGKILSASNNFADLINAEDKDKYIKKSFGETLGIDPVIMGELMDTTFKRGFISNQPVLINDLHQDPKSVWLTSYAIYDPPGQLDCIALVLRTDQVLQSKQETQLADDQQKLIDYYLTKAGTHSFEENQAIKAYFLEHINSFYSLVRQFSGEKVALKLLERLNQSAMQNKWRFSFSEQHISMPEEYEGQVLANYLSALLSEARNFAIDATNLKVVEQEIKILDANLSPEVLQYIDQYDLRGNRKILF